MSRRYMGAVVLLLLVASTSIYLSTKKEHFAEFSPLPKRLTTSEADVSTPATRPETSGPPVRVAVIGGMVDTGFWQAMSIRFEAQTHIPVQLIATGQKDTISAMFRHGGIDLITMHASDAIINLVADGYARDPQPWARNDMIVVGPADDPAGIKGTSDVGEALRKIATTKSKFVVHSSLGAQDVMLSIMDPMGLTFDPAATTMLFDDKQRRVLQVAADLHAYTMLGRIPFETGRIPNSGLVVMVRNDERLRRPFVVAVADAQKINGVHVEQAAELERFMRSEPTQRWIGEFGRGKWDDQPMFFPITLNPSK